VETEEEVSPEEGKVEEEEEEQEDGGGWGRGNIGGRRRRSTDIRRAVKRCMHGLGRDMIVREKEVEGRLAARASRAWQTFQMATTGPTTAKSRCST
jgi:hypothetical protein